MSDIELFNKLVTGFEHEITVGIHSFEGGETHGETTNAELGARHEFGIGVPQRSFIRAYFDENQPEIQALYLTAYERVMNGGDPRVEAGRIGEFIVGKIKERMLAGIGDPERTLVKTGQLIGSIKSRVDER